ncbi:hypothetical protein Pth03_80640 [Planotetraspora thailandica]|uniref:DUF4365 domain-containing protein n=1 Tax=Planotetraspora thailandica TaxID=487172 RepID=A0A8J3Y2F3_9ACTN|nr:DUF4365 domain-containing protein [Planotetraspora thailandica]GII59675.1 hypothetical protein Pth03_80640 [Planotetraspora thailandica]
MTGLLGTDEAKKPRQRHIEPVDSLVFTTLMEQLQQGYVSSVAATAGCTFETVNADVWGVDVQIIRAAKTPSEQENILFAQLKSTTQIIPDPKKDYFSYQFTKRQYFDHMVKARTYPKAILIVMTMPPKQLDWTSVDHSGLLTKRCCYWAYLEGATAKPGVAKPTVRIPTKNKFDAYALIDILDRVERGESLDG